MKIINFSILIIMFGLISTSYASKYTAKELVKKSDLAVKVRKITSNVTLTSISRAGKKKIKSFFYWKKRKGNTRLSNSLVRFTSPVKIKGQGILFIERGIQKGGDDIHIYLPAYKRTRRLEKNQQRGNFMGTVFFYSDMVSAEIDNYKYKIKKETKCPISKNVDCYLILSRPKTKKIMERRGYSSTLSYIRKDNYVVEKMIGFDFDKKKFKEIIFEDIKMVDKKEKKWMPLKITARHLLNGRYAIYQVDEFDARKRIPADIFTMRNLSSP